MNKRVVDFLEKHRLLDDKQYGFRKSRSTIDAVSDLIGRVTRNLNNNETSYAVLIDLSKAFDSLVHDVVLDKLDYYGFRGVTKKLVPKFPHE